MSNNPFDWVRSISETKENLLAEDTKKQYNSYVVNKALSYHLDCILLVNEMNTHNYLDKDIQYSFLFNSIRKRKRYSSWEKKNIDDDLKYIKKYYNYNNDKAYQALKILSKEQINYIKDKLETFGLD